MVSFDTNVLVYATATGTDPRIGRAHDLLARAMTAANAVLLLQTLAEFSNVAIRKSGIPPQQVQTLIEAWRAVLPVQAADESDLMAALEAVRIHRLAFWDAMLWASAHRAGIGHFLTEDFQDGFELGSVKFVNPFDKTNDRMLEELFANSL